MELESKFFRAFFFPFLSSIILSTLVVIIFLLIFSVNKYDKIIGKKIIDLEKKYSKNVINSANIIITNKLLKFQTHLNEQILHYQKIANKLLESEEIPELDNYFLKCLLTLDPDICYYGKELISRMAFWLLDDETIDENLDEKEDAKLQLIAYSNIIPNVNSIYESSQPNVFAYFFYFEKTELYISFPILDGCYQYYIYFMTYPYYEEEGCFDDNGYPHQVFRLKCEKYFINIMKSKTNSFDNNYLSQNKSIFISNFYTVKEYSSIIYERELTMCIEFDDPITRGKGYACVDAFYTDIIKFLENLNLKVDGYFFVSNIGFSNLFYFPQGTSTPKTSTEQIYQFSNSYKLHEKTYFRDNIEKLLSSNYIEYISENIYDEVFVNGKNSSKQLLDINGIEFKYSIYPIVLNNLNGKKEHVMSLVYIYNDQLYLDDFEKINSSKILIIILEFLIFIVFGYGLLYIIYLSFKSLSKHIVIPIKNVNYMLKGINIGGKNRLKFLDFLQKKYDENLVKLEKVYLSEIKNNKKEIDNFNESYNDSININSYDNGHVINDKLITELRKQVEDSKYGKININKISDANKKYDELSNYIEKELNFYDYDEQLLLYRPFEIQNLVKSIMDLKEVMIFTSKDREGKNIINYSYSEQVFKHFKNKDGEVICESNIGNLQSQLLKFDKGIYHLAISLQDNQLKKFLNKNLSDEFDQNNSLLNKISNYFNKTKKIVKNNVLVDKQINISKSNFSQKKIGILINTRYGKLINAYYKFFKNLQKSRKISDENINEQFMNTSFHTIDYYHKIIIQYIYLSYVKNDLIKIGESIIDYIEFLIKFKFKTLSEDKNFLKIHNRTNPTFKEKQEFKKKIFDKIISWFNLFDNYISYVKANSSLDDPKSIIDVYSHSLNSENFEFNLESQTTFMFKVNIQKNNFLKGKFCLCCKNYNDALFYFISAAKKDSIVIDGLIKKRSLKHIYKLLTKMKKKFEQLGLKNFFLDKELNKINKENTKIYNKKMRIGRKGTKRTEKDKDENIITFGKELEQINEDILQDISEYNTKQEKDIIILIDFNIYNKKEENLLTKRNIIDTFVEETLIILNNYLSLSDRLGVMIYFNEYKIICPLINLNQIDTESFSNDLINYKNSIINEKNKTRDFNMNINELTEKEEFYFALNNDSENSHEDSFEISEKDEEKNYEKIKGLLKTINYIVDYSKMKEGVNKKKYIIIFSDIINIQIFEDSQLKIIFENLKGDKYIILILIGKNKKLHIKNEQTNKNIEELILSKFGEKSEIIDFDNMNKIKTILSNNKVIKEEIFYPNEIYK